MPGSPIVQIFDAYEQAKKDVDPVTETSVLRTFQDEESMTRITYRDVGGESVFVPTNLQSMCEFEMKFVDRDAYKDVCVLSAQSNSTCVPQYMSVVHLFYNTYVSNYTDCPLLSQNQVDGVVSMLFDNAFNESVSEETRLAYSFFLSQDVDVSARTTTMTKSVLVLGSPLTQDEDDDEELTGYNLDGPYQTFLEAVGKDWVDMFGFEDKFLNSKYRNNFVMNDRVSVKWLNEAILSVEFEYMVQTDMAMAGASIVFVMCWMWFHMKSFPLAMLGMYQIVMSIPIALFLYRYFFQIYYFQSLHQMVIFLVLGIGADDIFVFVDGWKMFRAKGYDLKTRMHHTFERTYKDMMFFAEVTNTNNNNKYHHHQVPSKPCFIRHLQR